MPFWIVEDAGPYKEKSNFLMRTTLCSAFFCLMQGIRGREVDVVEKINGVVEILLAVIVKIYGLIYGVRGGEIDVVEKIDGIV